jgi:glycosyltransferase involved in cell wall biosynthesis/SAM-dependent methyltransferase
MWESREYLNFDQIKKLSSKIHFHGAVSHDELAIEYSKSSICVIPSNYESFSLVSLEAQACGCFPIAHDVGGIAETMISGETGLLYSPNKPEILVDHIYGILTRINQFEPNRSKAINWVRENFSWDKTARGYQDYFYELINKKGKLDSNLQVTVNPSSTLVSVIIPCYNHGKYLDDALNSIFAQDYKNYEIIIIDDKSKDDSVHTAEMLINQYSGYNIKLIKLIENKGQACARNTGINAARGKYIITMDADDKIKPSFMSKCIQAFDNNKSIDIVYTDVQNFGNDNIIIPSIDYDPTKLVLFNYITVCSMFSKKMWEEVGGYDETLKGFPFEDWEFWLKAAEYGFIGYHINEPLFNYRKSENESYNSALKNHNIVKAKLISRHPVLFSKEQMKWAELVLGGDKHFIELNKENPGMPFTSDLEQHLQNLALVIKDRQNKRISDTKPRVLFTMYGWNESGGGTTFPKSVVEELVSRGYDVGVFFADLKNDPAQPAYSLDFSVDSGAMLFGIYNRPALFIDPDNPEREIEDEGIRKRFSAVLESFKPDVIHFHNFHGLSFVMAEEANKRAIPTCFTPHNYHIIDPNLYLLHEDLSIWKDVDLIKNSESVRVNPGKIDLYKKRIETTTKLLTEWISVTLCVSNRQKELLKQYCGDDTRFALVHQSSNMVDQLWENPNLSKQSDRRIKKPIRIGFIGSVLPIKGVHYIAVIAQAFDKSDVEFHIYGFTVDAYLNLLKSIDKKGNLVFHGEYHINQLEEIANNIDIAIVPSLLEDCAPLVMLELHALRLPIIGARIGGIPDFIEPEVDGFLYTYDSVEDLLKIINKCVAEPQIIEKMRHNITQKHSFKNYIDHVIKIYIDLAKGMQLKASEYNLIINDSSTKVNKTQMNNYNPPSDSPDESYFEALSDRKIKVGSDRTQAESLKLNLGCGEAIEAGYINIDLNYEGPEIVNMDARILEYEDASVDTILAADLLQCFSHNEIGEVLAEWARVLKPEGKLIISCTSLKQISRLLLSGLINSEIASKLLFGNQLDEAHFYYAAFDEDFLRKELVTAGFTIESYDEANEAESLEDINISIVISAVKSEKHSMPELTNENSTSNQVSSLSFNFGDTHEDIKNVKAEETFDNSLLSGLSFNFDDKGEEAEYEVMEPEQEFDNQDYFAALSDRKLSTDAVVQTVPTDGPQINIVWEGSQFVWHSLALINREICYNIIKSGVAEVTIVPYEPDTFLPEGNPKYEILKQHDIRYKLESDSKTKKLPYSWIRHQWPPKAEEPKGSKWFIIQPWEFSTLRTDFVSIFQNADEVWTPSNYSRNSFINSGIEFDHAQVIPNGCDPELWSPMGKRFKFNTDKKLKFLFVGGTIYRKGIDILLQAYVRTFNGLDNVSLIIKDMGGDSFYAGQTAKNQIDIIQKSENSPEIIYIDDYFTEEQMVELYKACDVFVCPYRGEGFSLPTLEAMASGLPVIVTKGGSTDDFVDESIGWLISADKKSIGREIGGLPLTGEAYLLEPNEDELVETMKSIYGDPSQIFSKGLLASLRARTEWTWKKATIKLLARLDLHNGTTMAKIAEKNLEDYRDDAIALGEIEKKIIAKDSESAYSDLKKLLRNTNMTGRLLHHAYCRMAELCINLMKLDEVDQYLRKAREIYSSIDELYLEANKNFAEEKYSDALDGATKAMQNWKDDKYDSTIGLNIQELLSFTADTLLNDEDPNGALLIYLEVLKLNNNNANAYFGAGISHLKMGSNDDALRMFEWALRINPDYEMAKKMIDGLKITK